MTRERVACQSGNARDPGLPSHQRIRAIRSERWVSHPRAQKAIQVLELILDHPRTSDALDRNFWRLRNGQDDVDAEILYVPAREEADRGLRQRRGYALALQKPLMALGPHLARWKDSTPAEFAVQPGRLRKSFWTPRMASQNAISGTYAAARSSVALAART